MKKLIINADDFGLSLSINKGIIDAHRKGAITDISIIADGEAYEHAAKLAKESGIKNIGAHILLSQEKSESDKYYRFPWGYVLDVKKLVEVENKIREQIEKIKNSGLKISHLDSHQHVHMWPGILEKFIRLAKEYKIKFIRFPRETKIPNISDIRNLVRTFLLSSLCGLSKNKLINSGIQKSDYFYGHFYSGRLNKERLLDIFEYIKDGVSELSCHPGYFANESCKKYWWHSNCENELKAFTDPDVREALKANHIELVSYSDL